MPALGKDMMTAPIGVEAEVWNDQKLVAAGNVNDVKGTSTTQGQTVVAHSTLTFGSRARCRRGFDARCRHSSYCATAFACHTATASAWS